MIKNITILILFTLFATFPPESYARPVIKFKTHITGKAAEVARLNKLVGVAEQVANSEAFEQRVKGAMIKSGKAFSYSDESGPEVYRKLVEGAEIGTPADGVWNLFYIFEEKHQKCFGLGRWKKCSALVYGWTDPSYKQVYINSVPWNNRDDCGIVGTIVHEQAHKLGYSHPFKWTSSREYSVPYALGNVAAEICKKFI